MKFYQEFIIALFASALFSGCLLVFTSCAALKDALKDVDLHEIIPQKEGPSSPVPEPHDPPPVVVPPDSSEDLMRSRWREGDYNQAKVLPLLKRAWYGKQGSENVVFFEMTGNVPWEPVKVKGKPCSAVACLLDGSGVIPGGKFEWHITPRRSTRLHNAEVDPRYKMNFKAFNPPLFCLRAADGSQERTNAVRVE